MNLNTHDYVYNPANQRTQQVLTTGHAVIRRGVVPDSNKHLTCFILAVKVD